MSEIDIPLLEEREDNNPYYEGFRMIYHRLKWDFSPISWKSKSILKSRVDKYKGQKAVILCNGPSLLKTDFSLLRDTFTFGLNKINLLFDKKDFKPSCIVSVNKFVIEQNKDFFNKTDIDLYLSSNSTEHVKSRKNVIYLHSAPQLQKFARDCSISINEGATVTYVAMQLAFHLGFEKIALVGCDHNFKAKGTANKTVVSGEKDVDHFDPNYFAGGVKWQLPDLFKSEVSYQTAKDIYEASGRKIYNCTDGGKLEIYDRISLEQFLEI